MNYLIRRAQIDDIDEILGIEQACFERPWSRLLFEADLKSNPNAVYFVACSTDAHCDTQSTDTSQDACGVTSSEDALQMNKYSRVSCGTNTNRGKILGFIGAHDIVGEINITNVAVSPEYRGRGVAFALISAFNDYYSDKDIIGITLEVRVSNAAAIHVYEKSGFAVEGCRRHYYSDGEDALIMWKRKQQ